MGWGYYLVSRYFDGGYCQYSPILKGKNIIVTGANSGIGLEAAKELAKLCPSNLILACRNKQRGLEAEK